MKISNQVVLALQNYHKVAKEGESGLIIVDESKGYYDQFFRELGFQSLKTDTYFLPSDKVNAAINIVNSMVFQTKNITDLDKQMWSNMEKVAKKNE
jgi:hypothetical protein